MNKFGFLLSVLLLAGTSNISAQMDASIKAERSDDQQ